MSVEKRRIQRAIKRKMLPDSRYILYEVQGSQMILDLSIGNNQTLYFDGIHEPETTNWLKQHLTPHDTFLDVGANIGYYSCIAARLGAAVFAFEPCRETAKVLEANVRLNQYDIIVDKRACSDWYGRARFYITKMRGRSSLHPRNLTSHITSVPTVPLGDLFSRADVVKIDVEGGEPLVLKGMGDMLKRVRYCIVEFIPANGACEEIADIFEEWHHKSLDHNMLFWRQGEEDLEE